MHLPHWEKGVVEECFLKTIYLQGGQHVDYITDQIVKKLVAAVEKKQGKKKEKKPDKKGDKKPEKKSQAIKPFQVKIAMWLTAHVMPQF